MATTDWIQPDDEWVATMSYGRDYVSTPNVWIGTWDDVFGASKAWDDSVTANNGASVAQPGNQSPLGSIAQIWLHCEINGYPKYVPDLGPGETVEYETEDGTYLGQYEARVSSSAADNDVPPHPTYLGVSFTPRQATFPGIAAYRSFCSTPISAPVENVYSMALGQDLRIGIMCQNIWANDPEPTVAADAQNSSSAASIFGLYRPPRYRITYPSRGLHGHRQRHMPGGVTSGAPTRQRHQGGWTGGAPLRQR